MEYLYLSFTAPLHRFCSPSKQMECHFQVTQCHFHVYIYICDSSIIFRNTILKYCFLLLNTATFRARLPHSNSPQIHFLFLNRPGPEIVAGTAQQYDKNETSETKTKKQLSSSSILRISTAATPYPTRAGACLQKHFVLVRRWNGDTIQTTTTWKS
jgi:hypothetical protein